MYPQAMKTLKTILLIRACQSRHFLKQIRLLEEGLAGWEKKRCLQLWQREQHFAQLPALSWTAYHQAKHQAKREAID